MSEIELLYKNAGVEKREQGYCDWDSDCPYDMDRDCGKTCPYWVEEEPNYPPFTAEKQLELIKWLVQNKRLCLRKAEYSNNFYMDTIINRSNGTDSINFEVCLASQVNNLWQDLTESESEQIRSILNG